MEYTSVNPKSPVTIYVDTREKYSAIYDYLIHTDAIIETKPLQVGDFILSDRVGVERKEVHDFLQSIIDKRLLEQLPLLHNTFECPLLIIEGFEDIYNLRDIHPNALRGMIAWITVDMKIPIIPTKDAEETAAFLITIAQREQIEEKRGVYLQGKRKPKTTKDLQEHILSSLPGVGRTIAQNLLREFDTIKNIVNADEEKLTNVKKIGKKKAHEIKKILEQEYKK